jgi:hypothetical protein
MRQLRKIRKIRVISPERWAESKRGPYFEPKNTKTINKSVPLDAGFVVLLQKLSIPLADWPSIEVGSFMAVHFFPQPLLVDSKAVP